MKVGIGGRPRATRNLTKWFLGESGALENEDGWNVGECNGCGRSSRSGNQIHVTYSQPTFVLRFVEGSVEVLSVGAFWGYCNGLKAPPNSGVQMK